MRSHPIAVTLGAVLLLAGCSSAPEEEPIPAPAGVDLGAVDIADEASNGIWFLDGDAALAQVLDAVATAGGASVTGWVQESVPAEEGPPTPGRRIELDVFGAPNAYRAAISAGAQQVEVVVADGAGYVRGNAAYAQRIGEPRAAEGFVCTTQADALIAEWRELSEPRALLAGLLAGGALGIDEPAEGAATTNLVIGSGGTPVGVLTVSAEYTPLPTALVLGDVSGSAELRFDDWGGADPVSAPTDVAVPCA